MSIQRAIQQISPVSALLNTAEIDAEIREELEFHLAMRTEDNLRAGMSPEEARGNAEERFGDFEAQRRACRKITLGPRLMFQRLQAVLLVALLGTVIYQAVLLFQLQTSSRDEIESLTQLVAELRAGQDNAVGEAAPTLRQELVLETDSHVVDVELPAGWGVGSDALRNPWCDWGVLEHE